MRIYQQLLADSDLGRLAGIVGAHWLYVAGPDLGPDMYAPLSVIVGTDLGVVTITSHTEGADFEGFDSDYSILSVAEGPVEWDIAKRRGNVYVQRQGEVIRNVYVLRETISEVRDKPHWSYTTDIAIGFELSGGVFVIGKASHHTEMMVVKTGSNLESAGFPDRSVEWADELGVEHSSMRRVLPVSELLA